MHDIDASKFLLSTNFEAMHLPFRQFIIATWIECVSTHPTWLRPHPLLFEDAWNVLGSVVEANNKHEFVVDRLVEHHVMADRYAS